MMLDDDDYIEDIDPLMKKVFKHEFELLEEFQRIAEALNMEDFDADDANFSEEELRQHYKKLLEKYRLLLKNAARITSISDRFQRKLFEAFEELEKQKAILYQTSITDQLTEVYNRGYIMTHFDEMFAHTKRHLHPFSCILLDIDNFKKINDTHKHQAGDDVLKTTAKEIANQLRETDFIGRYGGEEFLIILSNTTVAEARLVAEKIRTAVAELTVGKLALSVTISLGICDTEIDKSESAHALLGKADSALHHAKNSGKNRVVIYHDSMKEEK